MEDSKKLPWANKDLGQHFLNNQNIISKITDDFAEVAESIIEVGPGPGILTKNLAAHNQDIHVVEKDERMIEYLAPIVKADHINFTDALAFDFEAFINEKGLGDKTWLVSNLPYNISTPLLLKFLQTPSIKYMTLMFQREVADKVFAFASKKNFMGSLMALSQTYFKTSLLVKAPPGAFTPPPKVDSAVISFERIDNPVIALDEFTKFEKFLRAVFQFKRKQLGKVLKSYTSVEKIQAGLAHINQPLTVRAEALKLEDLQNLYKFLNE
ncbi:MULTISPECIES: 16S rRNA (adenine(1518)-N(6)/adenine(1519)-N(6))-dimethyltransferase RsmA [Halobacteriovorax]|uniref:Ribosomal RNA small subunit methyltransferase A n=1 Tax=Halobacteriovorax vibrionivorans TaxID=2152716 RepID=A0ABY0IGH8_9BACT|nr:MULTISPECIES: 16S rRNA (adenine(1518)-N(6)/adenine(1519)-N(6))-dimethyltransferase RsmA [Halobacteriovorax]AYF43690.1 ribosomal RNA small subunit methyltransferase A [Halobacteriovorax sp. BALOs_7]RZF21747.1 ribosomal RNA small subunit methyltransferase A [Halobacteriovorax vibrionivorans]TGD45874.1 ribosomal RNA small subunit methyltransferase A [Halobacteriovorax sp. Y22]